MVRCLDLVKQSTENSAKDQPGRLKRSRKQLLHVNWISTIILAHIAVRSDAWKRKEMRGEQEGIGERRRGYKPWKMGSA